MTKFGISAALAIAVLAAGAAQAAERAGVAAAVKGDVSVEGATRQATETVTSGMDLVLDDKLATGADSRAQAILIDETTLTLGPDSELTIDKFVFDPDGSASEISANFVKGAMRFVSGRIGAIAPQRVNVRTPVGTLGIRGTIAFAVTQPAGVFFGLLGPSRGNDLRGRSAGIEFENDKGKQETYKPGYGFLVPEGGAPGAVGPIPREVLDIVNRDFRIRPNARGQQTSVAYSSSVSGSDRATSFIVANDFAQVVQGSEQNDDAREEVSNDEVEEILELQGEFIQLQQIFAEIGIFDFKIFENVPTDGHEVFVILAQENAAEPLILGAIPLVNQGAAVIQQVTLLEGQFAFGITGFVGSQSDVTFEVQTPLVNGPQSQQFILNLGDTAVLPGEAIDSNQL